MNMKFKIHHILFILIVLFITSCSNTKYLPAGEKLYIGGEVKVIDDSLNRKKRKELEAELQGLLRPKPNSSILGLRPKLFFYNIAGTPKKEKGFKHWMKNKLGEPPVLASRLDLQYNADVLQNHLENLGYFRATASGDSTSRRRRVTSHYIAKPGFQYKIRKVTFPEDTTKIASMIRGMQRRSFLRTGRPYTLDRIKQERERIDSRLKENGFYYFSPDHLIAKVDSTVGNHQVDIILEIKNQTPLKAQQQYYINDIYIYPNYSLNRNPNSRRKEEIKEYQGFKVIDRRNTIKPQVFERTMFFAPRSIYNRTDHNLSLNRLINLGTFKFVKNQFQEVDSASNKLDVFYYLTPSKKKSIRVELLGKTNSANYRGTELSVNWINRNTFKGAEQLTISAFGGLETQIAGQNQGYNVYRYGANATLIFPRLITPFNLNSTKSFTPKTRISLGYENQRRIRLYTLNTFKSSFGYIWKESATKEHELNITEITYVNSGNVTQEYLGKVDTLPSLGRIIEKQLIFGPTYYFTFTNTTQTRKTHTFYYKGGIDLSATIVGLFNSKKDSAAIFGVPYSEYVKTEHDFRHYLRLNSKNRLASRIFIGLGFPYGNSKELPYIKQFFSGGTNSIRAFRARAVGPGDYKDETAPYSFIPDYSGDIKLELNTELRSKLFSIVEGAIFVDAGNVWLKNNATNRPGGAFSKEFLSEMAIGAGVGLRLDLSFLILRGDLATPIRKPFLPKNERWVFNQINFGNKEWRHENLIFNLAIGYPF